MTIVFPHIPKCGGTSVLRLLENSGIRLFRDYDHPPGFHEGANKFKQQACLRRNAEFSLLDFSPFDLIYGHFPLSRYASRNYSYVCLLRHPVDRCISNYFYFKNVIRSPGAIAEMPIINEIRAGSVGIVEFARRARISRTFRCYLDAPVEFSLVGTTDDLAGFVSNLSELLGKELGPIGRERENLDKDEIGEVERRQLHKLLAEEIALYDALRSRGTRLAERTLPAL
jgi:hypothetical protein